MGAGERAAWAMLALALAPAAAAFTVAPAFRLRGAAGWRSEVCGTKPRWRAGERRRDSTPAACAVQMVEGVGQIEMFRGPFTKPEFLPVGMARGFQKWVLAEGEGEDELRPMFHSGSYGEEDGWVDPFSFEELWLPQDLPAPSMKPSLSAVAKDGQIRYLMPALEFTVEAGGQRWWNRGVNSIPLARRWMDVNAVNLKSLHLVGFAQGGYESAKVAQQLEGEDTPLDDPGGWVKTFQCSANDALLELIATLAGPAGSVVSEGYHVLSVPLKAHPGVEAPGTGSRVRVFLTDANFDNTSPNALEYSADLDFDTGGGDSELDFLVRAAGAGRESEYLPDVYRGLYGVNPKP